MQRVGALFVALRPAIAASVRFSSTANKRTHLYALNERYGGKFVEFAGYDMPVQHKDGVLAQHLQTRERAGLFDVSHMGQVRIDGKDRVEFVESLTVADFKELELGKTMLSVFTNAKGGIIDDLMVSRNQDYVYMVVNAGCCTKDLAHMQAAATAARNAGKDVHVKLLDNVSLLALQGPSAEKALQPLVNFNLRDMYFLSAADTTVAGIAGCRVTRCGYTGEDGFEISVPNSRADELGEKLLKCSDVKLAGLGCRDSLRLEAGLCLYGHDMNEDITPVEAALNWLIGKRRRVEGGFPGFDVIAKQLKEGVAKKRVGLITKAPVREHTKILDLTGQQIGEVTSGGPSPNLKINIAMGYVPTSQSKIGTRLQVERMGKKVDAEIAKMPFWEARYYRQPATTKK